jgi:hypothetical protein
VILSTLDANANEPTFKQCGSTLKQICEGKNVFITIQVGDEGVHLIVTGLGDHAYIAAAKKVDVLESLQKVLSTEKPTTTTLLHCARGGAQHRACVSVVII